MPQIPFATAREKVTSPQWRREGRIWPSARNTSRCASTAGTASRLNTLLTVASAQPLFRHPQPRPIRRHHLGRWLLQQPPYFQRWAPTGAGLNSVEPAVYSDGSRLVIAPRPNPLGPIQKPGQSTQPVYPPASCWLIGLKLVWDDYVWGHSGLPRSLQPETLQISAANGGSHRESCNEYQQAITAGQCHSSFPLLRVWTHRWCRWQIFAGQRLRFNPADAALLGQIRHQHVDRTGSLVFCCHTRVGWHSKHDGLVLISHSPGDWEGSWLRQVDSREEPATPNWKSQRQNWKASIE